MKRRVPYANGNANRCAPRDAVWALHRIKLYSGRVFSTVNVIDEASRGALATE